MSDYTLSPQAQQAGEALGRLFQRYDPHEMRETSVVIRNLRLSSARDDQWSQSAGLPTAAEVAAHDILDGLRLIPGSRAELDYSERTLIEAYMDRGGTWQRLADELDYPSGDALRQRYRRLGGARTWSAGRPASGRSAGEDQ